nr:alcohol dehydrogenase catalytic domain-containing protein [Legionella fallonii]
MNHENYRICSTLNQLPFHFERRNLRSNGVAIEILYCGVCHSDLHTARNDWGRTQYPIVPGHEIVGLVTETGPNVSYKTGIMSLSVVWSIAAKNASNVIIANLRKSTLRSLPLR